MSAAAARRRKQLASKSSSNTGTNNTDAITQQLNTLLQKDSTNTISESTAYEALQLAQSQLRKCVQKQQFHMATYTYGFQISLTLLDQHYKTSVASQLMSSMVNALKETHTIVTSEWVENIVTLHNSYIKALEIQVKDYQMPVKEQERLLRVHTKFLRNVLGWSDVLGDVRHGNVVFHNLLGDHLWNVSTLSSSSSSDDNTNDAQDGGNDDDNKQPGILDELSEDWSSISLQYQSISHYAFGENPTAILAKLATLPNPTTEETTVNHSTSPALRDSLLTRAMLTLLSLENIRDAYTLLTSYISTIETRPIEDLTSSYLNKTDGKAPSHVVFHSMLLRMVCKDVKTGPLYTWLLKTFSHELTTMYKPEVLKAFTVKIGKVYFGIEPPPSMLSTLEGMMSMMGGLGGAGGGGMGGPGGLNPAMMQAMMQSMGGGGF